MKGLEQILATEASKDTSYNFASLYIFRKGLIIPDIPEAKTKNTYGSARLMNHGRRRYFFQGKFLPREILYYGAKRCHISEAMEDCT